MDYKALGFRIQSARKSKRLTQEQLSEKGEVSPSFLGHIERGTRKASIETLTKLCRALDISPSQLLIDSIGDISQHYTDIRLRSALAEIRRIADDSLNSVNI